MYFALIIFFMIAFLGCIIFYCRKRKIKKKICEMPPKCRCELLNNLIEPFGYQYDPNQDIFSNTQEAWQKKFGYGMIYDHFAPFSGMAIDCLPVYFDYEEKTWLIEFWKGQYGINLGCEAGVYRADSIVAKEVRPITIFKAADSDETPFISEALFHKKHSVAKLQKSQWWLTIFSMGHFAKPKHLHCRLSLTFPTAQMRDAFIEGLIDAGYPKKDIRICCMTVHFTFHKPLQKTAFFRRLYCHYVLWKNHLFCRLFCLVTHPFPGTCEKLLYLYYYLPFGFRRMLRLKRFKK